MNRCIYCKKDIPDNQMCALVMDLEKYKYIRCITQEKTDEQKKLGFKCPGIIFDKRVADRMH